MAKKLKRIHPVKKIVLLKRPVSLRAAAKEKEEEMDEGLKAIYGDTPEDLTVVTKGGSRLTYWLSRIVGLLAFAAIIIFAVSALASRGWFSSGDFSPLVLAVDAPAEVKSGETIKVQIPYENPEKVPLASLSVDVNVPSSFVITKMDPMPSNEKELVFTLGSVPSHGKGVITLEGTWVVTTPSTNTVQAIASYKPANFSSDFSRIATASVDTKASVLTLAITGPDKATPGADVSYVVKVTNSGTLPAKGVVVMLSPPVGFTVSKSTPAFTAGERPQWTFETFEPGKETSITVTGSYASDVTDVQQMGADVAFLLGSGLDAKTLVQATGTTPTDVTGGSLRLTLVGNGLAGDTSVAPGDTLRLGYRLENTGTTPITDAAVTLDFQPATGVPIVWSKANLDGGVMTKDGVVYDAKKIGTINPAEKKSFNLAFPVKAELAATDVDTFTVIARATIDGSTIQSSPLTIRVNAAVGFKASAHYYSSDGAPIGEGPLPPVVGTPTTFEVMWTITRALHPLEDLVITATLPPGVTYADGAAADLGKITYDSSANIVRFDATDVAKDVNVVHAKFYVKATPSAADVDKAMKLLSGSALRVTDATTTNRIEKETDALTTSLPDDPHAAGKGIVVAQ